MRLPDIASNRKSTTERLTEALSDWTTPTIRLGVTGLSRAGKTVFITALVRNLIGPRRMPFFRYAAAGHIEAAYLQPQPDDDLPRFAYERHVADLTGEPPRWPESTKRISQLRLTLEVKPQGTWSGLVGAGRMHLDIVDYPGEWLLDLGLIERSYAAWSTEVLERVMRLDHTAISAEFRGVLASHDSTTPFSDVDAEALAAAFRRYLLSARHQPPGLATLGPGRFLMPGDLDGSPMLTFAPLPADRFGAGATAGPLAKEFERRFEAYKSKVVQPFFRQHFARLDRQIILVDALAAMNGGARALADLRAALTAALSAFRPGQASWLTRLLGGRRIDRVLFAATKADHLPQSSHERLEAVLKLLIEESRQRVAGEGAEVGVFAIAAIRATTETLATVGGEQLACIKGIPAAGERLDDMVFDGVQSAAIFPGDLPEDPARALELAESGEAAEVRFPRFMPPTLSGIDAVAPRPWPHVRLDRAVEFLIGDRMP